MGLFKSKYERQLDVIIDSLVMNMSNNYKDNAQSNLKELEEAFNQMVSDGVLKDKVRKNYETILIGYKEKMQGYSHKDQKPYWT